LAGRLIKRVTYGAVYSEDRFAPTGSESAATPLPQDRKFV